MLIKVCLLLFIVGIYASYAHNSKSTTDDDDDLFGELDFVFPSDFLSKFPEESEFFRLKIIMYLFFNIFAKYFGENECAKFWSTFNQNDFNRVAIDAAFYEYFTKFVDRKKKHLVYNPLESSESIPKNIAIDRIGRYIDNLAADEMSTDQSQTQTQTSVTEDYETKSPELSSQIPTFGVPGKDFPSYCDIPQTSFSCADKIIPGIYADLETGCQVFHVCWPHRIDSFLCPIGTTFNRVLLTCDFWHASDCASSPILFDSSQFFKGNIPKEADPTVAMTDETLSTPESSSAFVLEPDCPEYDGTCQSLISKSLQHRLKFLPAKCKVTYLKPSPSKTSSEDKKHDSRIISDTLFRNFRDVVEFVMKATEFGASKIAKMQVPAQPQLKIKQTSRSHSKILKAVKEFASLHEEIGLRSEGQMLPSTIASSSDVPSPMNSGFAEGIMLEVNSRITGKNIHSVRKSTLIKLSKPSEKSKRRAFDIMMETMELGNTILNDNVLPFIEMIVLDHQKKQHSKKI